MKAYALAIFIFLPVLAGAGSPPALIVTFDMPHGGCRLSVNSDGSGSLAYGALPAQIRVKPGTFLPSVLVNELRRVAIPPSDGEQPRPSGSVKFGVSEQLFWFSDRALARGNFLKALASGDALWEMEEVAADRIYKTCREI